MKLSVIGLGKLGICSAACFAAKGFEVIGADINKGFVDAINNGNAPIYEPELQELIASSKDNLRATQDCKVAIYESDITFLIVPTPSEPDGHFSDKYLQDVLRQLSSTLKETAKKYHLFVIISTVSPGTVERNLIPLIESLSGKELNKDFGVCYSPAFIALGTVITDFLNPDMILIGESNKLAGDQLIKIYEKVCENKPYIARMSIINAEITKISLNSYITLKISFANSLANICEAIPGADIDVITKALGADRRISPYYFKGGLSYGGPCFPRDNRAFAAFAREYEIDAKLAKTTDVINHFQVEHIVKRILNCITNSDNNTVSILGLAYKPNTPVIEESPGVKIIEKLLKKKDIEIVAYDPLAMDNVKAYFGRDIFYASSVRECFANSSLCVITTQTDEFRSIDDSYIVNNPTTIIDCWRILNKSKLSKKIKYITIGRAS